MKIGFFGTPDFVLEYLDAIYKSSNTISFIVTAPDKPKGRGQKIIPPAPKVFAIEKNIPYFQPENIKDDNFINTLKSFDTDIFVVIAYGKKLPKEILELPKLGSYNVHFSLLPRWRGAAPVNWAILSGDTETGVTLMKMDEGLDTGDIFLQEKTGIGFYETSVDVFKKLIPLGIKLLLRGVEILKNYVPQFTKQDERFVTYAKPFKKSDGLIDWSKGAFDIHNMVRALQPWPSAYTNIKGKLVKIWKTDVINNDSIPGKIEKIDKSAVLIGTGKGIIKLLEIQEEGKNKSSPSQLFLKYGFKNGDSIC
ncbi:MAG: methionyl-tRNA formyltransferase [Proteobacteria bacterium]|nr:methionyl-tRNA formyltransferase [Pseudomonadota bacterium]